MFVYVDVYVVMLFLLQECGTVPAKPFPKPTNGMAKARWKLLKGKDSSSSPRIVSEGAEESVNVNPLDPVSRGVTSEPGGSEGSKGSFGGKRDRKASITEAEVVEAFKSSMNTNHSKNKSSTSTESQAARARDAEQDTEPVGDYDDTDTDDSASSGGRSVKRGTMTMRRESYYLRGVADENRERQMLRNLAECLPGTHSYSTCIMLYAVHTNITINVTLVRYGRVEFTW